MYMAKTIIETKELTKQYGEITAVQNLDLKIQQGEVFGLLGPNGAGKTTTTLMLLGLTEPTSGWALIDGHDCTRDPIAVKRAVGYLPDSVGFYPEMTGRENLRFTGRLNGLDPVLCEQRITALLDRVGMTYAADRKTGTYSRGMKQRLGIADVLMKDPKVIIKSSAPQEDQISMLDLRSQQVCDALSAISIDTLTPIEAMNELYKLKKMLD